MSRRLNVWFLVKFLAVVVAIGVGVHLLHGYQVQRNARHFLETAEHSLEKAERFRKKKEFGQEKKELGQALGYFQHYLAIRPGDTAARAQYALALDRNGADWSVTLREMDRVLVEDPDQDKVRYRLLHKLIEIDRLEQALVHIDKLLPRWPEPAELHHKRGWCLARRKKDAEAAAAFARAAELDPRRISSYKLWAEALLRLPPRDEEPGPVEQARAVMDRMVKANAKDFQAYLARSRFWKEQGSDEASKADLDQAVRVAPKAPAVTLALAEWHLAQGDLKGARDVVVAGRAEHPGNAGLVKALAALEMRAERKDAAIALLRDVVDDLSRYPDLTILLIELLIDEGELKEARTRLDAFRSEGRAPLLADYLEARLLVANANWPEALNLLERVRADLHDRSDLQARVHSLLGLCHQHLGDEEQRLASYRRAVLKEPDWSEAKLGLAAALAQAGAIDEALLHLSDLRAVRKAAPLPRVELLYARTLLAQTLRRPESRRDWQAVNQAIKEMESRDPDGADLALLRAEVLAAQDRYAEAEAVLSRARAAGSDVLGYWTLAADLAARRGKGIEASQILDEAQSRLGDRLELRVARVHLWSQSGGPEADARIASFLQGIDGWPAASRAHLLRVLADAAHGLGETKQAMSLWQRLAELEPDDIRARASLLELALNAKDHARLGALIGQLRDLEGEQGKWWRYGTAALLTLDGGKQPAKLEQARKLLDRLAAQHRDWSRVALLRARVAETRGDTDTALGYYQEAIRLGERNPRLVRKVIGDLAARKRLQEADDVLLLLEERGPLPVDLARQGTEIALALPNRAKARQRALQPFNLESNDYRVQTWLVRVYHALGEEAAAEDLARKAAAQHPGTPETWIALVSQLARTGKREEARALAEQSRSEVPSPAATSTLARCLEALGDLEEAEETFVQGWKEQPADFILAMQAVDFYERVDRLARARPMLESLLGAGSLAPREFLPRLRRQLALALVEEAPSMQAKALAVLDLNGRSGVESPANQRVRAFVISADPKRGGEAVQLFTDSLKRGPAQDAEMVLLARIHEKMGDLFAATGILEHLVLSHPEDAQYLARLTHLLAQQGRAAEARSVFERLEHLEPASFRTRLAKEAIQ